MILPPLLRSPLHRLLKEIEQEASAESPPATLSSELQSLVERLAERLHADADERVAAALEPLAVERREHAQAIARWQAEAQHFRDQLEQTEQALTAAQAAQEDTNRTLADTRLALQQWQERAAGLERQLAARDVHLKSIEDKYAHAQEALTHFRQAAKEQRDQELRRHEHDRQSLQVELRRAQDSLSAKTQDLLQLNRDNERLTGRVGLLETAVRDAELDVRQQRQQFTKHAELEQQHRELSARWALLVREQAEKPTTPGLANLAQARHGVTASYSTIQKALVAWRRLGCAERPRELSPQFMQMLVTGFTPMYQQLLAEAREAFEPRLAAAEEQVTAAAARVEVLRAELDALTAERNHLRGTIEASRAREAQLGAEAARAAGQAAELKKQLQQAMDHARTQALELEHAQARATEERRQEREALLVEQRRALESAQAAHALAIEALGTRHAGELRVASEERTMLQAQLREASLAKTQLEARRKR